MRIKSISIIKGFGIPAWLPWHLTNEVYVPVNCNGEFHWVLIVIVLKEWCIKVYDSMSSSRTQTKFSIEIQKIYTLFIKYLESREYFEQKYRNNYSVLKFYHGKNWYHLFEVIHVDGITWQASNNQYHIIFYLSTAEMWCY